jgi:F-type H+-transporting ATPase subunit delta
MQEKLTIARPYAAAAFAYAAEHDALERWAAMLEALAAAVADPTLAYYIGHPKVSDAQLLELIAGVLGDRLDAHGRLFVQALIEAERLELAPEIAQLFERQRAAAAGLATVSITSAFPLTPEERARIDGAMRQRLGRDSRLEAAVDPALIGGAVIRIGDSVIDLSLRGRLAGLAQNLA